MNLFDSIGKKIISSLLAITTAITGGSSVSKHPPTPKVTQTPHVQVIQHPLPQSKKKPLAKIVPKKPTLQKTTSPSSTSTTQTNSSQKNVLNTGNTGSPEVKITATQTATTPSSTSTKPQSQLVSQVQKQDQQNQDKDLASTTTPLPPTNTAPPAFVNPPLVTTYTPPMTSGSNIDITNKVQNSIVNIYCTTKEGNLVKALTGSGVLIDPRGIVLTNAHVAQYVILQKDFSASNLTCIGRTNSPASGSYEIEVVYISPKWVENNYKNLSNSAPIETGEFDFALLRLKSLKNPSAVFPHLTLSTNSNPKIGENIVFGAYPALIFQKQGLNAPLRSIIDKSTIRDFFSFSGNDVDLVESEPSVIGEPGSSGGATTDDLGNLLGIIATTLQSNSAGKKYIHFITIGHINKTLNLYNQPTLQQIINSNPDTLRDSFNTTNLSRIHTLLISGL